MVRVYYLDFFVFFAWQRGWSQLVQMLTLVSVGCPWESQGSYRSRIPRECSRGISQPVGGQHRNPGPEWKRHHSIRSSSPCWSTYQPGRSGWKVQYEIFLERSQRVCCVQGISSPLTLRSAVEEHLKINTCLFTKWFNYWNVAQETHKVFVWWCISNSGGDDIEKQF